MNKNNNKDDDEQQQQQQTPPPPPVAEEKLYDMRVNYRPPKGLNEQEVDPNPFILFTNWFNHALTSGQMKEPNAMTLCTVSPDKWPSGRIVLLKSFSENDGFIFFTNYRSAKSLHMHQNPRAALVFYWPHPDNDRSVRIEGIVKKIGEDKSEEYFQTRPRGSQIGAWVSSQQSAVVEGGRAEIDKRAAQLNSKYPDQHQIPKPDFWGGWSVIPKSIEFWQGRPDRLHDRLRYDKQPDNNSWKLSRLWP